MEEWFQKHREKYGLGPLGVIFTFLSFIFVNFTLVTLVSDIGFSNEVTKYRWSIIIVGAFLSAFIASIWWALNIRRAYNLAQQHSKNEQQELRKLLEENNKLHFSLQEQDKTFKTLEQFKQNCEQIIHSQNLALADLEKEKQSLFQLMKKHQAQAEENVIVKLKRFATMSVQQQEWLQSFPHVVSFRIEPNPIVGLTLEQEVRERVTVNINLGKQNHVIAGMIFQIRDPVDKEIYGIVVVKEAHTNGSTCEIINIGHQAFWAEALTAIRNDQPKIIGAPKNELIPQNSIEIEPELAEDLLKMLENIRIPDFG